MSLITVAATIIVVGVLLRLVNAYVPMDGKIKKILNVVAGLIGLCVLFRFKISTKC